MQRFALALLLFAASACGVSLNHEDERKDESYSYDFDENGCKTGKHSFDSKADYCKALQNEALNGGCAATMRKKAHEADCGG